ncbi:MoaD/ThiS family protein [Roseivirga sp. E12]|uniref:MoaD/ThiS family protein n=1 Tax=Roseivirga sp. E12 TaxID=2819237 RepID=UPI001ABD25C2|nr:MoaD/ThiS family protein [Roseivirga sp. E12]MBO3697383.1 MoaD/ThiS family protein [Roseivirga sp. E12]
MEIQIIAFGIAKDIINGKKVTLSLTDEHTVGEARRKLSSEFPDFSKLASLKFAVNANYVEDNHLLTADDEVVLIPPVSGG